MQSAINSPSCYHISKIIQESSTIYSMSIPNLSSLHSTSDIPIHEFSTIYPLSKLSEPMESLQYHKPEILHLTQQVNFNSILDCVIIDF
jgi:hypothetical protein